MVRIRRAVITLSLLCVPAHGQPTLERISLENENYRVEVTPENGRISRIFDKRSGIELITEPRLADNFRLLLPLTNLEGNYVLGSEQKLTSFDQQASSLKLFWKGPLKNAQGTYDIDVSMNLAFIKEALEINIALTNRTASDVAEMWYPILGGLTGVGNREDTEEMISNAGWSTGTHLFQHYPSLEGGAYGIPWAETYWSYPLRMTMPWFDLSNRKMNRGVYIGVHDTVSRFKVLRFELHPGLANRDGENWPTPQESGNQPVGLLTHWTLFPYVKPGEHFDGPPVAIQFHDGDWHSAARIYRAWFTSQFRLADPSKNWMYQQPGFLDDMFLLPEGNVKFRFADIPQWARTAKSYGIRSLLISGWNVGGHDGGYPEYSPDPRLGTWEELKKGIEECHRLGLKVFMFANVQPADTGTDWYKKELYKYRFEYKFGEPQNSGYGYGSLEARMGIAHRPLQKMSSGIPEFREIVVRQMKKLAEIGADGVHFDKLCPGSMNFNPLLKMTPDRAVSEGQLAAVQEVQSACGAVNPNFAISAECPWDRLLSITGVGWAWHPTSGEHVPVFKYTFPRVYLPTMSVTQPYDYTAVNNALRYGYQIFVGPGDYTESMDFAPFKDLSNYIREVIRLRESLKDTIYAGEFLDTLEASVKSAGHAGYGVFRNSSGKRACVLVNYDREPREVTVTGFDGNGRGRVKVYQPFADVGEEKLPATVKLAGERFAVVMEQ
jgi:hypothetical protein